MASLSGHPRSYHTTPAIHSFRRLPPSPSDTDYDSAHVPPVSFPGNPRVDSDVTLAAGHYLGVTPERAAPRYQPRKASTLSYQNSGARDFRDRSHSRGQRNLVVVVPPPDFPLSQGQLGNVLSMGPRHRLSQGILMPLFPSMFGQLNAIAREYNFPSTVGLCLYLHINENGITMTPRISDESWQYLFGHLFEGPLTSGGHQLPIGGSIEFDIDLNKARWFDVWASGNLRDPGPAFPQVITSLEAHWQGEDQTANADEFPVEDRWDASASQTLVNNSRPETLRHPPRKLSLVDRLELHGAYVPPKLHHLDPSSPTQGLSPIPQSAIPRLSKSDLERRVNSWRATTELYPASMTEAYQPVPDTSVPAGATTMDEYALERNFQKGFKIDEYLCSVTSPGPGSPVNGSPIASSRLSSVHLDRRANGTVLLTPTMMTSWGPNGDDWYSVISTVSRLPSPDAGERVVEDTVVPRPPAVWGNSFGWRSATIWKEVYPYSVSRKQPTIPVHLRCPDGFVPQYPNLVIYPAVYPQKKPISLSVWGSSFGWQKNVTWRSVYPFSTTITESVAATQPRGVGGLASMYPSICIYPAVYPFFDLYPACATEEDISLPVSVMLNGLNGLVSCYPSLVIYPAVYPHFDVYPVVKSAQTNGLALAHTSLSILYPNLVIYPAVYPYFDLYPAILQVAETLKWNGAGVKLVNAGHLTTAYPNMTIYPSAYPYLDIYPSLDTRKEESSVVWGISFGWLLAKTWLQVYPLHVANPLAPRQHVNDQRMVNAGTTSKKQAVWGTSFGWNRAATWRAVWPTSSARPSIGPVSVCLGQQNGSSSNYPYLVVYPSAYPYFDIYPPRTAIIEAKESQVTENDQYNVDLIPHYPNLVIYPAVYPHLDVYPAFARVVERGNEQYNLRLRRIEVWRARAAAQIGLVELLANNHIWKVDEPLQLDLADYAWSRTSAGPLTPLESVQTQSISGSVHLDRRIQGSVLATPSTATTWGPPDDDWYSDVVCTDYPPSPDLGQRNFDDVDNIKFSHQPWHFVGPFSGTTSNLSSIQPISITEYPYLVIYPFVYPHFDLYPSSAKLPAFKNQVTKTSANLNIYPVFDIYPVVYPHFNIYPNTDTRIGIASGVDLNVQHERVEMRLPSLYPDFDIYHACYPYNLDSIYPPARNKVEATQVTVGVSCRYPWLVIYPAVYPFITPYPDSVAETNRLLKPDQSPAIFPTGRKSLIIRLPAQYPVLDIYPAGYPWSLESIYPPVSIDDYFGVIKPQYPCILIYPAVYPFVQPYPSDSVYVPGSLEKGEYESAKAFLALSERKCVNPGAAVYPYLNQHSTSQLQASPREQVVRVTDACDLVAPLLQVHVAPRRARKTHTELHASVFRCLEKRPARQSKTHVELHDEMFQDGVVWTPSGYVQDLSSMALKKREDAPVRESPRSPMQSSPPARPPRSRTPVAQSPDKVVFPLQQPPALPPLRVRSPSVPSQPSPAVSEMPMPRVSSPSSHMRTTSSRLSQVVKSIVHRHNSSAAPASLPTEEHKERPKDAQSPTRFLSLTDRRPAGMPPLPHTSTPEFLTRVPRTSQTENLVFQRARAYEQATATNQSFDAAGTKETQAHSPFMLPPLPPLPPMMDVTETIEKSGYSFT